MRGNRTGRKGLPRFAPLLYTKAGNLLHFPFYFCDLYHTGKSAVQSLLRSFNFSKYFFLGSIVTYTREFNKGGCAAALLRYFAAVLRLVGHAARLCLVIL